MERRKTHFKNALTPRSFVFLHSPAIYFPSYVCTKVSCGAKHTLVVTVEGRLFAWGDNRYGQCGLPWPSSQSPSSPGSDGGGGGGNDIKHKTKKKLFADKLRTTAAVAPADNGEGEGGEGGCGNIGGSMVVPQPSQVSEKEDGRKTRVA